VATSIEIMWDDINYNPMVKNNGTLVRDIIELSP
jgi:hypothetical protein